MEGEGNLILTYLESLSMVIVFSPIEVNEHHLISSEKLNLQIPGGALVGPNRYSSSIDLNFPIFTRRFLLLSQRRFRIKDSYPVPT